MSLPNPHHTSTSTKIKYHRGNSWSQGKALNQEVARNLLMQTFPFLNWLIQKKIEASSRASILKDYKLVPCKTSAQWFTAARVTGKPTAMLRVTSQLYQSHTSVMFQCSGGSCCPQAHSHPRRVLCTASNLPRAKQADLGQEHSATPPRAARVPPVQLHPSPDEGYQIIPPFGRYSPMRQFPTTSNAHKCSCT